MRAGAVVRRGTFPPPVSPRPSAHPLRVPKRGEISGLVAIDQRQDTGISGGECAGAPSLGNWPGRPHFPTSVIGRPAPEDEPTNRLAILAITPWSDAAIANTRTSDQ